MDVFISYSRKDRQWKERVSTFMRCMQIQNLFDYATWDDGEIKPSEDWRNHIVAAIDNCKVAVLLVSPDFLSSEFITEQEIPHLLRLREEGQVAVLPLIVRPCAWEVVEWLAEIQLHPAGGAALSGESEHDIENHLKQLSLEVHRLVSQSRAGGEEETEEASATEAELAPDADADGAPDGGPVASSDVFKLFTEREIEELLASQAGAVAQETLLLFRTRNQRTWLIRGSDDWLYCVLDSRKSQASGRMVQWRMQIQPGINIRVREKSRYASSGLVDIGKRQNWLYSKQRLHPDPAALEAKIRALIS